MDVTNDLMHIYKKSSCWVKSTDPMRNLPLHNTSLSWIGKFDERFLTTQSSLSGSLEMLVVG